MMLILCRTMLDKSAAGVGRWASFSQIDAAQALLMQRLKSAFDPADVFDVGVL